MRLDAVGIALGDADNFAILLGEIVDLRLQVGRRILPIIDLDKSNGKRALYAVEPLLLELVSVPTTNDRGVGVVDKVATLHTRKAECIQRRDLTSFITIDLTLNNCYLCHII